MKHTTKEGKDIVDFVGRDDELELLNQFYEGSVSGEGKTILLSGEAGIGKTRLIDEFISEKIDEGDVRVIQARCLAESKTPLMPLKEAFRKADLYHLISETSHGFFYLKLISSKYLFIA